LIRQPIAWIVPLSEEIALFSASIPPPFTMTVPAFVKNPAEFVMVLLARF
jgi:hypothetical protein